MNAVSLLAELMDMRKEEGLAWWCVLTAFYLGKKRRTILSIVASACGRLISTEKKKAASTGRLDLMANLARRQQTLRAIMPLSLKRAESGIMPANAMILLVLY